MKTKYSWNEIDKLINNWKLFADENQGEYKTKVISSNTYWEFEINIPILNGIISFFTNEYKPLKVTYTLNQINFYEFLIYQEDLFDKIGKLFGLKEIEIGDCEFDKRFIIKCKDAEFIKKILFNDLKIYLINNRVCCFKLEITDNASILELVVATNELDLNNMNEILILFKQCISILQN